MKIIYPLHFGFQQRNSVDHALIGMTEAIKNNWIGCGLFIDLQKAFDSVSHSILLAKLEHYGIREPHLSYSGVTGKKYSRKKYSPVLISWK